MYRSVRTVSLATLTAVGVAVLCAAPRVGAVPVLPAPPQFVIADAWKIDPAHSGAGFAVRHLVVSTVRGRLGAVTGTVWYDGTNTSSIRAEATIDVKAINSGDAARDNDLRGAEFFAVDKFPTMTFKSSKVIPGAAGHFKLVGTLTIRDVSKEVTLDVEGPSQILKTARELRTVATATVTLNRFDFGLKWNRLIETGGAIVGPDVVVTLDLEVTRPNGSQ